MLQHLPSNTSDIFNRGGDAVVHQCPSLGGQNQILGCARSGAPVHPFVDEVGCRSVAGAAALHQIDGIMRNVFGNGYAGYEILQFKNAVG